MEVADSIAEKSDRIAANSDRSVERVDPVCTFELRRKLRVMERAAETEATASRKHASSAGRTEKALGRNAGVRPQTGLWQLDLRPLDSYAAKIVLLTAQKR